MPSRKHQGISYWPALNQPATQVIRLLGWTEACPSEMAKPWLRLSFSKGPEGYCQPFLTPSSFPTDRSDKQRGEEHRKTWYRASLGAAITLRRGTIVPDPHYPLTFVPEPRLLPPRQSVIGIVGKRTHCCHSLGIPWVEPGRVSEITVRLRW